ncbi:MAG TPA: VOC family protein [Frankiaceae bacterium]|jgi:catechol 2,3-dioxygenase-like lactoylglutathione lyase family enzyme|nr:VOC family protein [Frankiaceae bacterium]
MLSLGSTVVGVADVARAARFWNDALGYVPREPGDGTFVVLVPGDGSALPRLSLMRSESPAEEHPRVHLDLYAGDVADRDAEVERLVALGAERVAWEDYPPDADFVVLADPDGNRFCVIATVLPPERAPDPYAAGS